MRKVKIGEQFFCTKGRAIYVGKFYHVVELYRGRFDSQTLCGKFGFTIYYDNDLTAYVNGSKLKSVIAKLIPINELTNFHKLLWSIDE